MLGVESGHFNHCYSKEAWKIIGIAPLQPATYARAFYTTFDYIAFKKAAITMRRAFAGVCVTVLFLRFSWVASPASDAPEGSDSEAAVREAVSRFRAAVGEGTYEALLPTVTSADGREIRERLAGKLPLFRVENLAGFRQAVSRASATRRGPADAEPEFNVTLPDADHARLDIEPLLSFRHSVYMVREDGAWKVDLALTLRRTREPRPKEEIISICRQALRRDRRRCGPGGDEALPDLRAHRAAPAQTAAQLLEELYDNFQQVFPFDLGIPPRAQPASADAGNPGDAVEPRAAVLARSRSVHDRLPVLVSPDVPPSSPSAMTRPP